MQRKEREGKGKARRDATQLLLVTFIFSHERILQRGLTCRCLPSRTRMHVLLLPGRAAAGGTEADAEAEEEGRSSAVAEERTRWGSRDCIQRVELGEEERSCRRVESSHKEPDVAWEARILLLRWRAC